MKKTTGEISYQDALIGKPRLRQAIREAGGRFCEDDVAEVLAIEEEGGRVGDRIHTWWIVSLRPERGLSFGGVQVTIGPDGDSRSTAFSTSPTILGAMSGLPGVRSSFEPSSGPSRARGVGLDLWRLISNRTLEAVDWSPQLAIRRLIEGGSLLIEDVRDHDRVHLEVSEVASLRVRLDDTFDPPQRRGTPDGEPLRVADGLALLALHTLDRVHGLHAWGIAARRARPSNRVAQELADAGYNVGALVSGVAPVQALGLG